MNFDVPLSTNIIQLAHVLGYGDVSEDKAVMAPLAQAAKALEAAVRPKWAWRRFALERSNAAPVGLLLATTGQPLPGQGITAHLAGCSACLLLAVTLGAEADQLLRAAQADDMAHAVVLDAAASVLAEQYADEAERLLRIQHTATGEYLTLRFSPGYGDFPLQTQAALLALLDARRAIGLTVNSGGLMLPVKSITAVLGLAEKPVAGRLAGCEACTLREKCERRKDGKTCG